MRKLLVIALLLFAMNRATAATDTISIHLTADCNSFMPHRDVLKVPCSTCNPVKWFEEDDSIRVCGQIIDGYRKSYYLIVYDTCGVKRLEGNFWDHFVSGHCISYDFRGRKLSEGDYKLVRKKGMYYPSVKTGTWLYYNIAGTVIKRETFK